MAGHSPKAANVATRRAARRARKVEQDPGYGISLRSSGPQSGSAGILRWQIDGDPFLAVMSLAALRLMLVDVELTLVAMCRRDGISWDDVGFALGVTGEAARQRLAGKLAGAPDGV